MFERITRNPTRIQVGPLIGTIAEWAWVTGLPESTLRARINAKWPAVEALATPSPTRHAEDQSCAKQSQQS